MIVTLLIHTSPTTNTLTIYSTHTHTTGVYHGTVQYMYNACESLGEVDCECRSNKLSLLLCCNNPYKGLFSIIEFCLCRCKNSPADDSI